MSGLTENTTNQPPTQEEQEKFTGLPNEEAGHKQLLTITPNFANLKVVPNSKEEYAEPNFPKNLHNVAELFLKVGRVEMAEKVSIACTSLFETYEKGPDGRTTHSMGRAIVCWNCGHCGLPSNGSETHMVNVTPKGICTNCRSDEETNFLKVTKAQGIEAGEDQAIPWLELKAVAPGVAPAADGKAPEGSIKVQEKEIGGGKKVKVKPNDKCPCNSGKKAKVCCHGPK